MIYKFAITELEFRLIREFIHDKFGIFLKEEKRSFVQMKLYPRALSLGFDSFSEYFQFMRYNSDGCKEATRMISLLTNTETYFFRETPQLDLFRNVLLPELRDQKLASAEKTIRVLSAGCSTGEEPYTLAMIAFDTGSFFWGWDLKIIGMDVNQNALEVARRGVYYQRSFRMTEPDYQKKFFTPNSGNYQTKDTIKRMTSFVSGNVTEPAAWEGLANLDVVFCRNVLIYFSEEKLKRAVQNFHRALRPGGHLLLGHSETLTGIFDEFETRRFPQTIIYRKKGS